MSVSDVIFLNQKPQPQDKVIPVISVVIEVENKSMGNTKRETDGYEEISSDFHESYTIKEDLKNYPCSKYQTLYHLYSSPLNFCSSSDMFAENDPAWDYYDVFQSSIPPSSKIKADPNRYSHKNFFKNIKNCKERPFKKAIIPGVHDNENNPKSNPLTFETCDAKIDPKNYYQLVFE